MPVASNAGASAESMAEHGLAMALAAAKHLPMEHAKMIGGAFNQSNGFASTVSGGTNRSIDGPGSWQGGILFSAQ